jgi:hypothetical protein
MDKIDSHTIIVSNGRDFASNCNGAQSESVVSPQQTTTGEFLQTSERYRCLPMLVARHVVNHKQDYQAQDQQTQPQPHLGAATAPVTILRNQADSVITS